MRACLIVLAALALGACNDVYSRAPLAAESFQRGDPQLRSGLWQLGTELDSACRFDIRQPVARWPDCAAAFEYRHPGQFWAVSKRERRRAFTVRLVAGDPVLAQAHWNLDILGDPRSPEPPNADTPFFGWMYAGLTVTRTDAADRITEARMVAARCGPPPQSPQAAVGGQAPAGLVTDQPFPGLKIVGASCVADDLDTVMGAIRQSAALGEAQVIHWVRDQP